MANLKSQIKRNRTNEKRRVRNKAVRSEVKTHVKQAVAAAGLSFFGAACWLFEKRRCGNAALWLVAIMSLTAALTAQPASPTADAPVILRSGRGRS